MLALAGWFFHPDRGLAQPTDLLPAASLPRHLHPHVQGRRLHHAQVPPHHVRLCHCFWLRLPHPVQEQQRKKYTSKYTVWNTFTVQPFFAYPAGSLVKTFVMMVGELEYEALFPHEPSENPPPFEYYSNLLFVVFVLVMGIVVMNLLVGLAVDDIQEIQENAELHQLTLNVSFNKLRGLP